MPEFEIFRKGTHIAANGEKMTFGDRELDDIVGSYNPQHFRAPLILTHNTFGVPDDKLADYSADDGQLPASKHLAFGFPDKLKRVGDAIVGVFNKISPKFQKLNREGAILSISSSLYKPTSPNNPYPGKWALRHVAGLGVEPPAIKGMEPLSLSELPGYDLDEFAVSFRDREEGVLEFCLDYGGYAWGMAGRAFQGLREWLIEQYDMETANRVLPSDLIGILQAESTMPDASQWELNSLRERVAYLEGCKDKDEDYSMSEQDFTEREQAIARREAAIAERETALRKTEFLSFCEGELKGKLTPAIAPAEEVAAFMEFLHNADELDFSDTKTASPLEWFKGLLSNLPQQVDFGRLPVDDPQPPSFRSAGDDFDAESVKLDADIRAYQSKQRSQGRDLSYSEAMDEVLAAR